MLQVDADAALTMVNALVDCLISHARPCPLTTPIVAPAEARAVRAGYLGILPAITADDQDPNPGVKKATERWLWAYMADRAVDSGDTVGGRGPCYCCQCCQCCQCCCPVTSIPSIAALTSPPGPCDFRTRPCPEGYLCMGHRYTSTGQVLGTCTRGTTRYVHSTCWWVFVLRVCVACMHVCHACHVGCDTFEPGIVCKAM